MQIWHWWVITALAFFILEIFTSGFAVACFSIGALAAAAAAALKLSLIWQIGFFAAFTFLAFLFVRPFIIRTFFKEKEEHSTNADALIGRTGRVSSDIIPATGAGRVAIDGDDWKAASEDGTPIAKGEPVVVTKIDSVIITVKKQ